MTTLFESKEPRRARARGNLWVNGTLAVICLLWLVPTIGLLVSSFRTREDVLNTGWWTVLPHRAWETVRESPLPTGLNPDGMMTIEGVQGTFTDFRNGVVTPTGTRVLWVGNKRLGTIQVQARQWVTNAHFTLENYRDVLTGKQYQIRQPDGSIQTEQGADLSNAFLNSLVVTIPATVIPILLAAFAAYAFAWMRFPGRRPFFVLVVALLVVPLQIALVPILRDYQRLQMTGTFLGVWLAHTGFGLPLATYLLYNYISTLPRDLLESAFIDGAGHWTIFMRLILPLSVPALASFAIFQFLWVWNDYLVALIFIGSKPEVQVLTMRLADLIGSRGNDWQLLTAGAFISMILPLMVFFALQRYFVQGLLAGSVKG